MDFDASKSGVICLRCFYQRLEQAAHQRVRGDQTFGMPLHTKGKGMPSQLDRLDQAVGRVAYGGQARRQIFDGLVMGAVDEQSISA